MSSKPLIRWAGSKRKILPLLKSQVPDKFDRYVEPFCGSASLFFEISPQTGLLSDINEDLINALNQIKTDPFIREKLTLIPATKEEYYRLREVEPKTLDDSERAIRFLYLNRHCFNGVYRTNKKGKFNVPIGTKTGEFPKKEVFDQARQALKNTQIITSNYKEVLLNLGSGDFAYIDPPYSKSGKFTGEYGLGSFNSSELPEFTKILNILNVKGVKFLFSYRACEESLETLSQVYDVKKIPVKRHISGFKKNWGLAQEILVKNY